MLVPRFLLEEINLNRYCAASILFAAALASALSLSQANAQASCQPLYNALTKLSTTASHSYTRMNNPSGPGSPPMLLEYIYLQGKAYMKVGDTWTENPLTAKELLDKEIQNRKSGNAKCRLLRSDSAEGQPATLYSLHSENPHAKEDVQVWISRKSGLPLRQEADIDLTGSPGKRHVSNWYEYTDVRAPI
jgi:hypothetical protein